MPAAAASRDRGSRSQLAGLRSRLRASRRSRSYWPRPVCCGCGYSIRAPFDKSVKTVFVPIFKSQSFRRDLEQKLTEADPEGDRAANALQGRRHARRGRHDARRDDQLRRQEPRRREPVQPAARAQRDDRRAASTGPITRRPRSRSSRGHRRSSPRRSTSSPKSARPSLTGLLPASTRALPSRSSI